MPRLIDPYTRTDQVTAAINHVIVERGVEGLTMRGIGSVARISPSSLSAHYGSREHMLRVAASVTGEARLKQMRWRRPMEGVGAWLPSDDEDVLTERAWLGWCELWRSHDWIAHVVGQTRQEELADLAQHYEYRLSREELDGVVALLDGLRLAICAPERPLSRAEAHRVLARWTAHLTPDDDEENAA